MTAPASRAGQPGRVEAMSTVAVDQVGPTSYVIRSTPHAIHYATLFQRGKGGLWEVRIDSLARHRPPYSYAEYDKALSAASDIVGRVAMRDLSRMNKGQLDAMDVGLCPFRLDIGVCRAPKASGMVWCDWHPKGVERESTGWS